MKYVNIGLFLLFVLILIFVFWGTPGVIVIRKIECFNQFGKCDERFFQRLEALSGKHYKEVKAEIKKIFNSDPAILDYSWQYFIPDKVRVNVIVKKAKFAIKNRNSNEIILIDKEGEVLAKERETNLPFLVDADTFPEIGEKVDETKLFALDLIWRLYYLFQIKEGELWPDRLEVDFPEKFKIILPLAGDKDIIIGSLKVVLSRLNQGNVVDLRYKNPIIR